MEYGIKIKKIKRTYVRMNAYLIYDLNVFRKHFFLYLVEDNNSEVEMIGEESETGRWANLFTPMLKYLKFNQISDYSVFFTR